MKIYPTQNARPLEMRLNVKGASPFPSLEVGGAPLTKEVRLIAALVARLGGKVVLTPDELADVRGVVMDTKNDGIHLST